MADPRKMDLYTEEVFVSIQRCHFCKALAVPKSNLQNAEGPPAKDDIQVNKAGCFVKNVLWPQPFQRPSLPGRQAALPTHEASRRLPGR